MKKIKLINSTQLVGEATNHFDFAKLNINIHCSLLQLEYDSKESFPKDIFLTPLRQYRQLEIAGSFTGPDQFIHYDDSVMEYLRQHYDHLKIFMLENNGVSTREIIDIWQRWSSNHLRAGTEKQEQLVTEFKQQRNIKYPEQYSMKFYEECSKFLSAQNSFIDNGYVYGTQWLIEPIPEDVVNKLILYFLERTSSYLQ
jgi:hypothetical protein